MFGRAVVPITLPVGAERGFQGVIDLLTMQALTNGKIKSIKRYTAATIDWLAVYDVTTERCYYVPRQNLAAG